MRILSGRLTETVYSWPGEGVGCSSPTEMKTKADVPREIRLQDVSPHPGRRLKVKSRRAYGENEMTYITDGLGLHQMSNSSDTEPAVSLHLYTVSDKQRQPVEISMLMTA